MYNYICYVSGLKNHRAVRCPVCDSDTVSNGIALSPTLHRAFDRGLFTVDDDYRVVVSRVFSESGNVEYGLRRFDGQRIILPEDELFYPSLSSSSMTAWKKCLLIELLTEMAAAGPRWALTNFNWHYKNIFKSYELIQFL